MKNYLMDESIFQYPESFKKMIELNVLIVIAPEDASTPNFLSKFLGEVRQQTIGNEH